MVDDPIEAFFEQVDSKKTRIVASPSFLLVFGGRVSVATADRHLSARNVLVEEISHKHPKVADVLLLPEHFPQWIEFGVYQDLLQFEEDLAYLTSLVVLISESWGAVAELGSFALIPSLAERLLVVIEDGHHDETSFISLGPVRRIEKQYENPAYVVSSLAPADFAGEVAGLVATIEKRLGEVPKTEQFQSDNPKHALLAIADFVDLFSIVRKKEIKAYLSHLDVQIENATLDRYLFVLEKLEIIQVAKYRTDRYLVPGPKRGTFLDYTSAPDAPKFVRLRAKAHVVEAWKRSDQFRMAALTGARKP